MKPSAVSAKVNLPQLPGTRSLRSAKNPVSCNFNIRETGNITAKSIGLLQKIAEKSPDILKNVASLMKQLETYDTPMMEWLNQSPQHVQQFFENPLESFKTATNAPATFITQLKEIASEWPQFSPGTISGQDRQKTPPPQTRALQGNGTYIDYSQGWDIVGAIYQKEANKGLILAYNHHLLPSDVRQSFEYKFFGTAVKINLQGVLDAPQIIGGTGEHLTMQFKFKNGFAEYSGTGISGKPETGKVTLDGVIIEFTTSLKYVESTGKRPGGKKYDFYINFTDTEAFFHIQFKNLPASLAAWQYLIQQALLETLQKNAVGKEYKLFDVELGYVDDKYPYLIPKYIRYAFIEAGSGKADDNILGVLLQTTGTAGSSVQLLNGTIPTGSRAAVILGNSLFTENILLDAVCTAFAEPRTTFKTEGSPKVIENTKTFPYKDEVKGYRPDIKNVMAWIDSDLLHLNITADVCPSAGLHITYHVCGGYKPVISTKEEGGKKIQVITFEKETYTESHDVTAEWWVWLIAFIALIIGTIILAIILAIIDGVCPDLGAGMFTNALGEIKWNYIDLVEIQEIHLNGPVQIGGKIKLLE